MPVPRDTPSLMQQLDQRSRQIFREIVELYLENGEPVGSRTLSRRGVNLSPASIRNVMADLVDLGLIESPHTSAGRAPTHAGLRLFVDGFMQIGEPGEADRAMIDSRLGQAGRDMNDLLGEASELLSGLTGGASLVASPTREAPVRQVDFVPLRHGQALAIIVSEDGEVENRLFALPPGLPSSALIEAGNYLNARMKGKNLAEARRDVIAELAARKAELDGRVSGLIEQGLVEWSGEEPSRDRSLIVRGQANLLGNAQALGDLDRVRGLFEEIERRQSMLDILDGAREAQGLRLFIGAENALFSLTGASLIVAPWQGSGRRLVGALAVIGPVRLNYARIIPMVDYTARVVGRLADAQR
jgi:heat-inducible transcriptional repressor